MLFMGKMTKKLVRVPATEKNMIKGEKKKSLTFSWTITRDIKLSEIN